MKILQTILITILISASCYCNPLAALVEDSSSMVQEEEYYDAPFSNLSLLDETDDDISLKMDDDIALNKTTSLCLTICTCTSRGKNSIVDVDCIGRGMTSIPIPDKDFEIFVRLDFSTNELVKLQNNSFRNFPLVKVILLSLAKIETVDVDSFNGLNNLKVVNLSDNYIMYIHPDMFKENPNLERVTLSGNPLVQVSAMSPFLNAPTLEFLDISNCKLQSFSGESLKNLKSLRNLDLSNNYLQTLSVDILDGMADLETVSLDKNHWRCDCNLQTLLVYVSSNNVYQNVRCLVSDNGEDEVWSTSSNITNCQNDPSPSLTIRRDTESNLLDSFVLIQEVSKEVEVETIFIPDRLPDSDVSQQNSDAQEKAMVFGYILFYFQDKSRLVYAILILVAIIIITAIVLLIVCLKKKINSRTEQTDRENQRKKKLMLSFGVEFKVKRNSFSPLLDQSSFDHDCKPPPQCSVWRPFTTQDENPHSLFEEYVSFGRPYHVCEKTKVKK